MFKKRPNFLNSAPTSTESALRLLSTPSVRFCLQTAICLVSLWALVIELHPLNCARAQAVCLFSDKVTMKELEEQRVFVKVLCKLGTGFMGMMLKPRCNRRSGCRKGLLEPSQKRTDVSVKDQSVVGCVFWLERHCPSWICTTWSDGKQRVVPGSFIAFEGCCAQEEAWIVGKQTWMLHHDNALAHASLFIRSYLAKHQTSVVPHPPYSPDLAPADFFLFPKLKTTLKGCRSKNHRGDSGKCDKRTARHHRKDVPGNIPTMERKRWERCIASRGVYFEGDSA